MANAEIIPTRQNLIGELSARQTLNAELNPGSSSTSNYERLSNKPSINNVELVGNKSFEDLNFPTVTSSDILDILNM